MKERMFYMGLMWVGAGMSKYFEVYSNSITVSVVFFISFAITTFGIFMSGDNK